MYFKSFEPTFAVSRTPGGESTNWRVGQFAGGNPGIALFAIAVKGLWTDSCLTEAEVVLTGSADPGVANTILANISPAETQRDAPILCFAKHARAPAGSLHGYVAGVTCVLTK